MTTKDQAIALEDSQEAANAIRAVMEEYNWPCNPANAARVGWRAARLSMQPTAPDCRTCEYMWIDVDLEKATSKESCARFGGAVCINGSLHKPAPKVVLWRTE